MYDFMQLKANEQLETFLDNHSYDESQLVELKIPVHNAYQNSWASYERYNGEVELNGVTYKYVKRKLSNDTLYLMCIQNSTKMRLESAKNDFFRISNDLVQNNDSKKADNSKVPTKNLQSVFYESTFFIKINSPSISHENLWLPTEAAKLQAAFHLSPEQPPDLA
jgi:hypothetical protein